ncbi:MAG: alpha/beta hydrolase [Deltaproteobacteria bacterium]|nr:alpha/beta hydrolase [Deltaproteobacteria bacterium]
MMIRVVAIWILMIASVGYAAEPIVPDAIRTYKTIKEGKDLSLHIFNPGSRPPTNRCPAIVFFFGGGWKRGTPRQFYQQAREFSEHGIVAISAQYRVKNIHGTTPVECVKDAKSAIRWVRQHADELRIKPNRIVSAGGSAGGHVAACTGVIEGQEEKNEDTDVSSLPNAMVLYNPVVTFRRIYAISPSDHVRGGLPPTLLFHGTADSKVPFESVKRFTKLMKDAGNTCVLVPFDGKDHGFYNGSHFRPQNGDADFNVTMEKSIDFLTGLGFLENVKGQNQAIDNDKK